MWGNMPDENEPKDVGDVFCFAPLSFYFGFQRGSIPSWKYATPI